MTRTCEPTAFEKQAASLEFDALALVDEAIGHLRAAERALLDEERQHGPHPRHHQPVQAHGLCRHHFRGVRGAASDYRAADWGAERRSLINPEAANLG